MSFEYLNMTSMIWRKYYLGAYRKLNLLETSFPHL